MRSPAANVWWKVLTADFTPGRVGSPELSLMVEGRRNNNFRRKKEVEALTIE